MHVKRWLITIISGSVLAAVLPLSAAPFTNGDFETGLGSAASFTGFIRCFDSGICGPTPPGLPGSIDGWTIIGEVDYYGDEWAAASGDRSVDLNGNAATGGISQTFDTVIGQLYSLTFYLSGNFDVASPDPKDLNVQVAGVSQNLVNQNFQFFQPVGWSHSTMGWMQHSLGFTATDTFTTLTFSTPNATGYGPVIDNVSIGAIPEPGTLLLLGAGLFALAGLGRYRRKR